MVGFLPQGNGLQSGAQTLTNRIISNPFVNQFEANPAFTTGGGYNPYGAGNGSIGNGGQIPPAANVPVGGGGGSAYTVGVLNSLQPLGVTPQQYPHLNPTQAPAPQNGGAGGFTPQQQNMLNNAFNQQSGAINSSGSFSNRGGPPEVMDKYGQMVYTNAPGGGGPHPANMWSPEQLYAQGIASRMGLGNFGSYAPGGYNAPGQQPSPSQNALGVPFGQGGGQMGVPAGAANPMQSVIPMQNMAKTVAGATFQPAMGYQSPGMQMLRPPMPAAGPTALPVLAGPPRTPEKPMGMPSHFMGVGRGAPRNY